MSRCLILLSGFLAASAALASGTPTPASETDLPRSLTRALNDTPMPTTLFVDETGKLVKDAAGLFGGAKQDAVTAIGNLLSIFDDSDFQKLVKDCGYSMFKGSRYERKVYLKGFLSANAPKPNDFMDRLLAATVGHFDKVIGNIKGRADNSFNSFKCEVDILGYPLFELDYYVDQGDAAMMVATIKALEANFYFLAAHDLNSESLPELVEQIGSLLGDDAFGGGIEGLGVVDFIRNSDRFLRPLRTSRSGDSPATCLQKAQTLFGEALDYLMKGDKLVRARTDGRVHIIGNKSDDLDHAVSYHSDGSTVALMRDHGSVVKTALTGTATINLAWVEDLVSLPKSLSRSEIQISLAPLFKASSDISTKMPRFTSGSLDEASVIPPTLGGLLPDLTEAELLAILAESVAPMLTGEWKFPKGNELKASVGKDLTKYTQGDKTVDFAAVDGLLPEDGAMRAGRYNFLKCYHGLTPGEPYTFVIDLKVPSGIARAEKWLGYLWDGTSNDALAFLKRNSSNDIVLWAKKDVLSGTIAKDDEWHRYVLTTDCSSLKTLYVDGKKTLTTDVSGFFATLTQEFCYLLADNGGESEALDVSYAAFYSGVMSEQEVRLNHARPLPHDAANRVLPTVAPSGAWTPTGAESAGARATCAFGVPLVKGDGGYTATRAAAPASSGFTAVIDCQLAKTRANGSVLVANGSNEAAGIYGTDSADSGAIDVIDDASDFAGDAASATALFGGRSRTTVPASGLHRLAIVRSAGSSDAAVAYYVDGRRVEAENPFATGSGLKPSAAMTYLAGDWAKVARVATYDTALTADEIDALGDASTVWPEPSATAPAVSVTAAADRIGLGRDDVELTVAYSFAANESGNVSVDFGDGTGDVALDRSGSGSVTFTHGYGAIGKKKIVVRAVDRTGAVAEGALTVSCVDVSYVAYALWKGGDGFVYLDATGRTVEGGVRGDRTALAIPDKETLAHFTANPSDYATLAFYNYELGEDTDWSDLDLSDFGADSRVDLKGHKLTLGALATPSGELTITDTTGGGELHIALGEGATLENTNMVFTGSLKLVKKGAGRFVQRTDEQDYAGGTRLAGGTLAVTAGDLRGWGLEFAGGILEMRDGCTIGDLVLTDDSTLKVVSVNSGDANDPVVAGGSSWDFGGHTLNLVFSGLDPDLWIEHVTGGQGTTTSVTFHNGTLRTSCTTVGKGWLQDCGVDASDNVCYDFCHLLRQRGDGKVWDFINRDPGENDISRFSTTLSVFGRFVPLSPYCVSVKMMGESTLDLSDANITLPWNSVMCDKGGDRPLKFASGAIVFVDLTGRGVQVGDRVVTWAAKPDASVTFCAVSKDKTETVPYALEPRADGLYAVGKMTGEWKFPKGDELTASVGSNLEKYTRGTATVSFKPVDGIVPSDGAMRADINNCFKCYHGLTPGEPYTLVVDLRLPSDGGGRSYKSYHGYLWSGDGDALATLRWDAADNIRLWYKSGTLIDYVAKEDEWHRYVLTTDGVTVKKLYVDGVKKAETGDHLARLTREYCYLLGDDDGEDNTLDVTYAAFYRGTMTDAEVAADHSRPVPHDANGVNLLTVAARATWTGAAGDGDFGNPANWSCRNALDEPVSEVLPYEQTVIHVSATNMFDLSYPPNLPFDFKSFEFEDPLVLQADFDWEGLDLSRISGNPTIDLNGHALSLGMSVNTAAPFTVTDTTPAGGELRLVAPKLYGHEIEVANTNISFTGSFTLVKRGDGVLIPGKTGQSNAGGLRIEKGTVRTERSVAVGLLGAAGASVTVLSNTTLSVTAGGNLGCCALTLAGGTLEVTGGCTMSNLWLTADSVFSEYADGNNDIHVSKHAQWDLGGHLLDIVFSGGDPDMYLGVDGDPPSYITIHNGTIRTKGYGWFQDCGVDAHDNVCYDFSTYLRLRGNSSVSNFVNRTTSTSVGVEGCTLSLYGTFTPLSTYCYSVTMQNGSAIDLRETGDLPWNSVMIGEDPKDKTKKVDCPVRFAAGATVGVDLRGRTIEDGQKVVSWATPPASGVRFEAICGAEQPEIDLEVRTDGLYGVFRPFMIIVW